MDIWFIQVMPKDLIPVTVRYNVEMPIRCFLQFKVMRLGIYGLGDRRFVLFGVLKKTRPPLPEAKKTHPPRRRPKSLPGPLHGFAIEK